MRFRENRRAGKRIRPQAALREQTEGFRRFLQDEEVRKKAVLILVGCALLTAFQAGRGLGGGKQYIVSDSGSVTGLYRKNTGQAASFPLKLKISGNGIEREEDVVLTLSGKTVKAEQKESKKDASERAVSQMITELEASKGHRLTLPGKLSDGSRLHWKIDRDRSGLMLLALGPFLIWLMYWDAEKKKKDLVKARNDDVMRRLPGFNDQLLMLLNCGMIFSDAYQRIAEGYRVRQEKGYFRAMIVDIDTESRQGNQSLIGVFCRRASGAGVKELSRVAGFISDNQYRGVDLTGKLEMESASLWEKRKMLAEEKGKLAETKLTMPLAVLLIALIIITAAPAILQVQGV